MASAVCGHVVNAFLHSSVGLDVRLGLVRSAACTDQASRTCHDNLKCVTSRKCRHDRACCSPSVEVHYMTGRKQGGVELLDFVELIDTSSTTPRSRPRAMDA